MARGPCITPRSLALPGFRGVARMWVRTRKYRTCARRSTGAVKRTAARTYLRSRPRPRPPTVAHRAASTNAHPQTVGGEPPWAARAGRIARPACAAGRGRRGPGARGRRHRTAAVRRTRLITRRLRGVTGDQGPEKLRRGCRRQLMAAYQHHGGRDERWPEAWVHRAGVEASIASGSTANVTPEKEAQRKKQRSFRARIPNISCGWDDGVSVRAGVQGRKQ